MSIARVSSKAFVAGIYLSTIHVAIGVSTTVRDSSTLTKLGAVKKDILYIPGKDIAIVRHC